MQKLIKDNPDKLEKYKMILLAILHNKGDTEKPNKYFKFGSPYVSLSRGKQKYNKVSYFTRYGKQVGERSFILVYMLNKNWPYYLENNELTQFLENLKIRWFPDIHSEILLLNGLYPHKLIGFFEVQKVDTNNSRYIRFILNPWFYTNLKNGKSIDYRFGVEIDQRNFHKYAQDMGYSGFLFHRKFSFKEFVSDLDEHNPREVINTR